MQLWLPSVHVLPPSGACAISVGWSPEDYQSLRTAQSHKVCAESSNIIIMEAMVRKRFNRKELDQELWES